MRLVLATRNEGKVRELMELLAPLGLDVLSLKDFTNVPEIKEDGHSFTENAVKKAKAAAEATGSLALADDSGLEVDYLNGAPGVYSARFAGEDCDDRANNAKLLKMLEGVPVEKRGACFRCVVAIAVPGGEVYITEGKCEGVIAEAPSGEGGFGYDPLFYVTEHGATFAGLEPEVKNIISHRGRALQLARKILKGLVGVEKVQGKKEETL